MPPAHPVLRRSLPPRFSSFQLDRLEQLPAWNDSEVVHDLPGGEWRRVQHAQGYRWILVNGEITFENDVCTAGSVVEELIASALCKLLRGR